MLLWHGARNTDSKLITDGEEGFDIWFARNGKYGVGNYFAINAYYSASDNFVHNEENGEKGIFLARVLVGDAATSVDPNRKMPPLKPDGTRYDSVTDKKNMYIVYTNPKAYPVYYIYFTWNKL